jgi:hypothetical protein
VIGYTKSQDQFAVLSRIWRRSRPRVGLAGRVALVVGRQHVLDYTEERVYEVITHPAGNELIIPTQLDVQYSMSSPGSVVRSVQLCVASPTIVVFFRLSIFGVTYVAAR